MVALTGVMTVVTISKFILFIRSLPLRKTIWFVIQSYRIEAREIGQALFLVSIFHISYKDSFHKFFLHHMFPPINKAFSMAYESFQLYQKQLINQLHAKICIGPKINESSRNKHRKFRKRSSGYGQWRIHRYKIHLLHPRFQHPHSSGFHVRMAEKQSPNKSRRTKTTFDTESTPVGMDTQASRSICTEPSMMVNLRPANIRVLGTSNTKTVCKWQGDWRLPITDDNGVTSIEIIPDTPLVPEAAKSILSPQHFAKKYPLGSEARQLCSATQYHDRCIFKWGKNNERVLTIDNDSSDVPTFYSSATITSFTAFMHSENNENEELFALETTTFDIENNNTTHSSLPLVSDDEDSISGSQHLIRDPPTSNLHSANQSITNPPPQPQHDINTDDNIGNINAPTNIRLEENISDVSTDMPSPIHNLQSETDVEAKVLSDTAGFLRWH